MNEVQELFFEIINSDNLGDTIHSYNFGIITLSKHFQISYSPAWHKFRISPNYETFNREAYVSYILFKDRDEIKCEIYIASKKGRKKKRSSVDKWFKILNRVGDINDIILQLQTMMISEL
jgi:hypothetical protein